jgi:flagellar basal-body rod protein FlgB
MQWRQERQRVLAENVSNADTPKFRPRDFTPPSFDRPANAVSLEGEMIKVASSQMDYQAATTLDSRSLGLVKTALGKR